MCYFTDLSQRSRQVKYGTFSQKLYSCIIANFLGLCYGLLLSHRRLDRRDDDFFYAAHRKQARRYTNGCLGLFVIMLSSREVQLTE